MICKELEPIHPGEYLAEMLEELNISQALFARTIGVSPMRISHIVKGTRPVTAELALLFAKAFEQTPHWHTILIFRRYIISTIPHRLLLRVFRRS